MNRPEFLLGLVLLGGCRRDHDSAAQQALRREQSEPSDHSPDQELPRKIAFVRQSGPGMDDSWSQQARTLFEQWKKTAGPEADSLRFEPAVCYRAGCLRSASFSDIEMLERITGDFYRSETFSAFPGHVSRTPPTMTSARDTGGTVLWVLEPLDAHASQDPQGN